jgi:hypothetical protein
MKFINKIGNNEEIKKLIQKEELCEDFKEPLFLLITKLELMYDSKQVEKQWPQILKCFTNALRYYFDNYSDEDLEKLTNFMDEVTRKAIELYIGEEYIGEKDL